jgi:capsular polysaccharide biosynthesis protein
LLILVITGCCLILGIFYAIFTTVEYRSKVEVLPEISNSTQGEFRQLLKNYSGLLGINNFNSGNMSKNRYIPPTVYPAIIQSLSFQSAMLRDTVYFAKMDSSMTLLHFFQKGKGGPDAKKETISMRRNGEPFLAMLDTTQISSLTHRQMQAINKLRKRIDITTDGETGVISVTAIMPDAAAAAQVCSMTIEKLKNFVKRYHSKKAQNILHYSNEQYQNARKNFLQVQRKLAEFKDEHSNLATATAQSQVKYLKSEYNLSYNVFNSVSQQRIEARMDLQKSIPVFNVLQHANIPLHRYSPKWIPVILVSIAVGLVLSFFIVVGLFLKRGR